MCIRDRITPTVATVTLTVWDQFQRDAERALIDDLNATFEQAHPGVKINRVVKSFDGLRATIGNELRNPDGADVGQVNQGADMRAVVIDDLLLDLTPYVSRYRWDKTFSPGILARNSFTADGSQFGTGNLYGVSPTAEVVGVYYNKEKFQELGLTVPRTFAEFETLLAKAKAAGEAPIVLGNLEQWPGIHIFSAIEHILLPDRTWLDDFVYRRADVSFDIPENIAAAAKVQEWVRAGYFSDDFANIGYEDAWKSFADGNGLMLLTGSWLSADIVNVEGERFGFFLLPPLQAGDKVLAIGGAGVPLTIRSGTDQADLAAEYLDWMVSRYAGERWLETGVLPGVPVHESMIPDGTLLGDIVSAYGAVSASNNVGHYIDWAGPTMYDVMGAAVQKLMALQSTSQEFVAEIQSEYAESP
jgi:raffinose/stachyose/melibiose transport system substrate-binding protein